MYLASAVLFVVQEVARQHHGYYPTALNTEYKGWRGVAVAKAYKSYETRKCQRRTKPFDYNRTMG